MEVLNPQQYATPSSGYVPLDFQAIESLGATLDDRYNKGKLAVAEAKGKLKNIQVRDVNQLLVNERLNQTRAKLQALSQRPDLENIGDELLSTVQEFDEDPLVLGALRDYAQYNTYKTDQQKRVGAKENGIRQTQYDRALAYSARQNSKSLEYDASTGTYKNMFSGYNSVQDVDISKDMMTFIADWKADKQPIVYKDKSGKTIEYKATPRGYINVSTQEFVDEKEVANALRLMVAADPKYSELINEETKFKIDGLTKGQPFTYENLLSLGLTDKEFTEFINKQGLNIETVKNDPAILEGLAQILVKAKISDGYVLPAAEKAGFSKIDPQYLTDNVLMEGIKAANQLKLEKYKQDREDDRAKATTYDDPIIISNEGVLTNKPVLSAEDLTKIITEKEARLNIIKRQLDDHANGNGTGNYSALLAEKKELETQMSIAKGTYASRMNAFKDSMDYEKLVDKEYSLYKKEYQRNKGTSVAGVPFLSREAFKAELDKPYTQKDFDVAASASEYGGGMAFMDKTSKTKTAKAVIQNSIIGSSMRLKKSVDDFTVKDIDGEAKSWNYNMIDEPDLNTKSGPIRKLNELHTRNLLENRGEYAMAETGDPFDTYLERVLKEKKITSEDKVNISMVITDGDLDAKFPFHLAITDKTTGKIIAQAPILPSNGGAEERVRAGTYLMSASPPNSENYKRGNYMAASGTLPQLSKTKLAPALATINHKSTTRDAPAVTPVNIGGKDFAVRKRVHQFKDADGDPIGSDIVFELILPKVDEQGNVSRIFDKEGKLIPQNVGGYLPNPTSDNPDEGMFKSLDDLQVQAFNTLYGKAK
jgi:hypothetical protein